MVKIFAKQEIDFMNDFMNTCALVKKLKYYSIRKGFNLMLFLFYYNIILVYLQIKVVNKLKYCYNWHINKNIICFWREN